MHVRLQGWFRTITLVPWYEPTRGRELGSVSAIELRRLLATELGASVALRRLIQALGHADGVAVLDQHELVQRVMRLIEAGTLRVEVEVLLPRPSDPIVHPESIEYQPPEAIEEELLRFWVESEADEWPELEVESESEPWPELDTRAANDELDFGTSSEPETLDFDTSAS